MQGYRSANRFHPWWTVLVECQSGGYCNRRPSRLPCCGKVRTQLSRFTREEVKTHKARLIVAVVAVVLIGGMALLMVAPKLKQIQRRAPPTPVIVQMTVPRSIETIAATVRLMFNDEGDLNRGTHKLPREDLFDKFYLYPYGHPLFPDDFQIQYWVKIDPYIRPYASVPKDKRKNDFYLYEPTADYYWSSDYYYNDAPAKFRCAFIIHLEPEANGSTKLAVFEYLPTIWVGERFGFSAHGIGPTSLHDIRVVESTSSDRVRLLDKIREDVR